jgi:GNAT superfamily N-acetyltransferase
MSDAAAPSWAIRPARPEDLGRIGEIRAAVTENRLSDAASLTTEEVLRYLDRGHFWVAEEGGGILGFSAANPDQRLLWALFVDPAHEGRGIGRGLIRVAEAMLRQEGCDSAHLTTQPGTRAERFYRRNGWQVTGHTPSCSQLILTKTLRRGRAGA